MLAGLVAVTAIGTVGMTGTKTRDVFCNVSAHMADALGFETPACVADMANGFDAEGSAIAGGRAGDEDEDGAGGNGLDDGWDFSSERPTGIEFADYGAADPGMEVSSNEVTVGGLSAPVDAKAYDGATFSINGGPFITEGQVSDGDRLTMRSAAPAQNGAMARKVLRVGGSEFNWDIYTHRGDLTPDDFAFAHRDNVPPGYRIESEPFRLSGVDDYIRASAPSYASWQIWDEASKNWQGVSTSRNLYEGDLLRARGTASSYLGDTRTFTMQLGSGSFDWNVTSQDELDEVSFTFTDLTGVEGAGSQTQSRTHHESEVIVLEGLSAPVQMRFTGSDQNVFAVYINDVFHNLGNATPTFWVENGDRIQMATWFLYPGRFGQTQTAQVRIGGSLLPWNVTYTDGKKPVSFAAFTDQSAPANTDVEHTITVSGFEGIAQLFEKDSYMSVYRDGTLLGNRTEILDGDVLRFVARSHPTSGASRSFNFSIGDQDLTWTLTSE